MGMLARLPIRLRLTLAFAAAMALVLAASGLFLYLRLGAALDRTIDRSLLGRAADVAALVRGAGPGQSWPARADSMARSSGAAPGGWRSAARSPRGST